MYARLAAERYAPSADAAAAPPRRSLLAAGPALCLAVVLSLLAIAVRAPTALLALTAVNAILAAYFRVDARLVRKALGVLCWQTAVLAVLYWLRFGPQEGTWPALRTGWQLFLAFVPGMIVVHGTSQADLERALTSVLPQRAAFVWAVCIKFLPTLLADIRTIYEAQVLRGARILPRDMLRPWHWPEMIHCVVVPAVVRALALAERLAVAAHTRDFGRLPYRTNWPGRPEREQ